MSTELMTLDGETDVRDRLLLEEFERLYPRETARVVARRLLALVDDLGFVEVTRRGLQESYQPSGTHLDRFPGPEHDAFVLEAAVPTPEPPRSPSSDARTSASGEPLAGRVVRLRR